jgi:hypothetical protein
MTGAEYSSCLVWRGMGSSERGAEMDGGWTSARMVGGAGMG